MRGVIFQLQHPLDFPSSKLDPWYLAKPGWFSSQTYCPSAIWFVELLAEGAVTPHLHSITHFLTHF